MKNTSFLSRIARVVSLSLVALLCAATVSAATAASPIASHSAEAKPTRFVGKLQSMDPANGTIVVANMSATHPLVRTFVVSANTAITENGKPASLATAHVAEKVTGTFSADADKLVLITLHVNVKGKVKAKASAMP